ncbi:DNA translocase FtsK [Parabacteroides sp. ZJ-118]|uniref:FtsK/SpoIIIE family DNA translocase n=1 Tax=Parabacteroides sp. ZJ-118 TaxID=2709398 RepID=UPI0013ED705B|nr:DNA translocase FtsK [Parabacteroides sp. ZJ-118]
MAKKTITAKQNHTEPNGFAALKTFFTNERTRFITGLIISILTIYVGLALISFFFTGAADQSKIENVPLGDLLTNRGSVENWTGVRGAYLSDLLMNRWFGISSFMILFFLGSVGAKLMSLNKVSLLRRFLFSASALIWGSVFFAFLFIKGYEDTFIYLGGQHGYYISEMFIANIGIPGTVLLLLGSFLIIAIFTSKKTIPLLQRMFSLGWVRNRLRREGREDVEQPDEQPEMDDYEAFDTEAELLSVEKRENRKTVPEYEGEEVAAADDLVVTIARGDDDPINEKVEEINTPESGDEEDTGFTVEVAAGNDETYDASALGTYDPRLDLSRYVFPTLDLLKAYDSGNMEINRDELAENQRLIKQALEHFNIKIASIKATVGPTVTLYEIVPEAGVRISKIKNLEDDIALSLSALQIRIIAPMPGKGTIGIEVPNKNPQTVSMQSVIASRRFVEGKYELPVAMGKTITNEVFMFDLCKTPHLLVAGATGQGKSVGLNAIITSLLYKKHPSELKFVMVDPKMVEFSIYSKIERHYLAKLPNAEKPIVTEPADAVATLNSLVIEMEDRYRLLVNANVRNIKEYNAKFIERRLNPQKGHRFLPYIVAVVDEFADLIAVAGREIELPISRIAAKARAVGIHMILATQRPDTKVITGTIKSNFPSRIAFKVASMIDSRTILDAPGANRLIGRGDMLIVVAGQEPVRVQCAFVDTPEVEDIVDYIGEQAGFQTAYLLPDYVPEGGEASTSGAVDLSDRDPLFDEAARLIVIQQQGSTSLIQRKFAIGYNRAGRLMDQLEAAGIVGPFEGSKARQVLVQDEYSLEQVLNALK